jgi:hypothetical protein
MLGLGLSLQTNSSKIKAPAHAIAATFNKPNSATTLGNTDTGQPWIALDGTFGISSNKAYLAATSGDGATNHIALVNMGQSDGIIQVVMSVFAVGAGVVFRANDAQNFYELYITDGSYGLFKFVAGTPEELGYSTCAPANGDQIKIYLAANKIYVYVNNTLEIAGTDVFNQTATMHGISAFNAATVARFDDLYFDLLPATVSLINPPEFLTAAAGDGSDETTIIQAIFDYATVNHKTVLIPAGLTFTVDQILVYQQNNFSIMGLGTLKHKAGATSAMLVVSTCYNFSIPVLNTDGNVADNETTPGGRLDETQTLNSIEFRWCHDFTVGTITDVDPASDSVYLSDVTTATIDTINTSTTTPCGRNGLSIIMASHLTINNVYSTLIGVDGMPSGIDFEPNNSDDTIYDVTINNAVITTKYGDGLAITNQYSATVSDIELNGTVTKVVGSANSGCTLKLNHVANITGNVKVYNESATPCDGAYIYAADGVDMDIEIYDVKSGMEVAANSENVNITGKIIGATNDGLILYNNLTNAVFNMEIKQIGKGGTGRCAYLPDSGANDGITFSGDYSKDTYGSACFLIEGAANTNLAAANLVYTGWGENLVTGTYASLLVFE